MKNLKRLSIPMLLGLLLISAVVGAAGARPGARALEQAWMVVTVPLGACSPRWETSNIEHDPTNVHCGIVGDTSCQLVCPVYFPAAGEQAVGAVTVRRVTMYAYDNYSGQHAGFMLYKHYPPSGAAAQLANATSSDSAADPQSVMDTSITNPAVYRTQAAHLFLTLEGKGPKIYGIQVHYTWM